MFKETRAEGSKKGRKLRGRRREERRRDL